MTRNIRLLEAGAASLNAAIGADYSAFARIIGARVPDSFPPEHLDADALSWTLRLISDPASEPRFAMYWIILDEPAEPTLIGVCGFKGMPVNGKVEVGYSILPEYQRRGYATMAVQALLRIAFDHPDVDLVLAETLPGLVPSIGVLEKTGFVLLGEGSEPGVIAYGIGREVFEHN